MNNKLIYILLCVVFSTFTISELRAEDEFSPLLSTSSYDIINQLKIDIQRMVVENERLEKQYRLLKAEYQSLFSQLTAKQNAYNKAKSTYDQSYDNKTEHLTQLESAESRAQRLTGEIAMRETQNTHLAQKIYEIEQKNRIRKLQLTDLQYERRELLLELKTNEMELRTIDNRNMNLKELKQKLEESLQKEQQLNQTIDEMTRKNELFKENVQGVKSEVLALENTVDQQKTQRDIYAKEVQYLKDKKLYMDTYQGGILADLREENQDLKTIVGDIEREYDNLNNQLELSINQKKTNQELIEDFIRMDKANQELRAKITDLQEKVSEYD